MSLLVIGLSFLVAEVLLLSAAYKIFRPRDYLDAVNSYRRLRTAPPRLRLLVAWAAPPTEVVTAVLVMIPASRTYGLVAACGVFAAFYVVVGGDDRPVIANCGCWGVASVAVSRRALLGRNIVLIGVAGAALAAAQFTSGTILVGGSQVVGAFVASGLMLPFALLALEFPELFMIATLRHADASGSAPARPGAEAHHNEHFSIGMRPTS